MEPLSEGDAVELVQHCLVEALSDAIRLWTLRLGPGMVNIFHREIELVFVMLGITAIFGAAISQNTGELHFLFVEEGHDPIVQEVGRGDRRLAIIEFGKRHFRIGVDESLLVDAADALHDRVFSVSTVARIVPILPRVSSPANASAATRDAKPLDDREWANPGHPWASCAGGSSICANGALRSSAFTSPPQTMSRELHAMDYRKL